MILLQERIQQERALSKCNQQNEEADVSADYGKQLGRAQLLTLNIEMVVRPAVLAVYLLRPHHLRSHAVLVRILVFAIARLDVLHTDSQKLQVLPLVYEVLFQALEQR